MSGLKEEEGGVEETIHGSGERRRERERARAHMTETETTTFMR